MNEFFQSTAFFVLMFAFGTIGVALDFWSSARGLKYGSYESNKFNKDSYGYFSYSKFLISHAILLGIGVIAFIFLGGVAGFFYILVGALSIYTFYGNFTKQAESRKEQIKVLKTLRDSGDVATIGFTWIQKGGRTRYRGFEWVYSDNPNYQEAIREVAPKLVALSQKPESQWFL